jgi:TonB family protein
MSERKPCVRCQRGIDAWAKICPFCNWDQAEAAPAVEPPKPAAVANYVPPSEFNLKKKLMYAAIGVVMLIASFGIGVVINRDGAPKNAPETIEEQLAQEELAKSPIRRADTTLVPTNEPGGIEQPVTSAPVAVQPGATPNDYQRTDATAVSATEYAEIARRAKAEKERMAMVVDPRSLTGPAYAQSPRTVRPRSQTPFPQTGQMPGQPPQAQMPPEAGQPMPRQEPQAEAPAPQMARRRAGVRTRPVPQYQPLPQISTKGTARLSLIIGADGRVKSVDVEKPLERNTAQLLSAVQSWRFKPATENGEPVSAPYSVEISFR